MNKKTKIITAVLILIALILWGAYSMYASQRPTAKPDTSPGRSIQVIDKTVTINTATCTPDLRRVDAPRSGWIIEVAGKDFDICLVNYGEATHDRNLNQKLPNRCEIPQEKETITLTIVNRAVLFDGLKQYCTP